MHLLYHRGIAYCDQCCIFILSASEEITSSRRDNNTEDEYSIKDPLVGTSNEIHPLLIYDNMMKEMHEQSIPLHDNNFEYKKLRKKLIDRIFELGDAFNMDILTLHQAIKYMEVMLHFINFYQRNNRTQRLPSDPKPVREVVPKTSVFFGKDTSNRVKALTTVKKELLMIT